MCTEKGVQASVSYARSVSFGSDERQAVEYGKLGCKKSKELKQKKEQKKTNNKPIEEIFMELFAPCDEKDKKGEYP